MQQTALPVEVIKQHPGQVQVHYCHVHVLLPYLEAEAVPLPRYLELSQTFVYCVPWYLDLSHADT